MSRWYTLHIKNEILFWFLLLSLLPLALLTGINYLYQLHQNEQAAQYHLQLMLDAKTELIESHLQRIGEEAELLASSAQIQHVFSDDAGTKDHALWTRRVNALHVYDLLLIDREGMIRYSVKKESDLGTNLISGPYRHSNLARVFSSTLEQMETQISDFDYYAPSFKEALFIAAPVYIDGKVAGVIAIQQNIDVMHELFMNREGLGESGELFGAKLTNENTIISTTPLKYASSEHNRPFQFQNDPQLPIFKAVYAERGHGRTYDYRGREVVAAWGYIPALRWGIVAKIDHEEILQPIDSLRFYSILLLFFVSIGIVIAVFSVIKHIVRPIEKLSSTVRTFSKQQVLPAFELETENEIGELARNFHEMSVSLIASQETIQKYAAELEEKVRIRTQELEEANERLEFSAQEMKRYLDIIDAYVITSTTDAKGVITQVSQAFCQITGYSPEELIGKKHNIIRHPDMPKSLYDELWKTLQEGKTWQGEIKNLRKDGTYYWVYSTITPVFDGDGDIKEYTSIRQDITDKKRIEEISVIDDLTGIYNRRHFNDVFPKVIDAAKRNNEMICFAMIDVDHFKLYNDHYGHQQGDIVLKEVAHVLKESAKRSSDYAFRLGGEEFGIVYKTDTIEQGNAFLQHVLEKIGLLAIPHAYNTAADHVTASAGVICINALELGSIDEIYKKADELLYRAKNGGRNQMVLDTKCAS